MWSTCKGWTIFQHTLMQQNESNENTMNNNEWSWRMCFLAEEANGKWRWTARASNSKLYNFQTEMVLSTQLKPPTKKLRRFQNPETRNSRIPGPTMISPSFQSHPRYCQCITRSTAGDGPQFPDFCSLKWRDEDHLIVFSVGYQWYLHTLYWSLL